MRDYFFEGQKTASVECLQLYINDKFKDILEKNSLSSLEDFMSLPRENSFRDVPNRLTVGLDLVSEDKTQRVYLKRHWLEVKSKNTGPHLEAHSEAENIKKLLDGGIPVPELVASGWGYINQRPVGFVIMAEVPGLQGDHFIEAQIENGNWPKICEQMIDDLASLTKKFHDLGFNHRDLYLCHFFADLNDKDLFLNMIDLQRVQYRKIFRKRWLVKDLSQLCYSSMKLVNNSSRMKFFLKYLGLKKLNAESKKLLRQILKKNERLMRRGEQGKDR